jgi:glucose-1-phosphate thymidylyltransferase
MKIIVPMAGRGSRLRPHTLTVPKPLVPVAGSPIVHRLVRDIAAILDEPIDEIAFVIGDEAFFGKEVEDSLTELAVSLGAKASIYRQDQPLGTGHAIMCAKPSLEGPAVIAYADTLIRAKFELDASADSVIWVKQVNNPQAYGVVELDKNGQIHGLVEKPTNFVSDKAVIGIYYFKAVEELKDALTYVLDNQIVNGGEYQINDGIKRMMQAGKKFMTAEVSEWMDCGNKAITVETNRRMLGFLHKEGETLIADEAEIVNSTIIEPCSIAKGVKIHNSTIGPYVSIGSHTAINNCEIKDTIVQAQSKISNAKIQYSMIGNHVTYDGDFASLSLGDYSVLE